MQNEKMEFDFVRSSKVIRYKINPQAADVLAVLIYKHNYWKTEGKLYNYKGKDGFYISYSNLMEETCYSENIIKKTVKKLKTAGLLQTVRQGLNKPNVYYIDEQIIFDYIKKHEKEYDNWRKEIRSLKPAPNTVNTGKVENDISRKDLTDYQDGVKI